MDKMARGECAKPPLCGTGPTMVLTKPTSANGTTLSSLFGRVLESAIKPFSVVQPRKFAISR